MTEEEKLQKAYFVMGLEPGAALDKITRRHKRLIMVWHPDRFPTADGKKEAEEELKQINNAKDDLKHHFENEHKASRPCPCKPPGSPSQAGKGSSHTGPGPGRRRTTQETDNEEAEAERRSKTREQQAAAEEAEKKRQKQAAENPQPAQPTAQQEADQAKLREDERLRWKVSLCLGAAWVALSLFGFVGTGLKAWWHDFSWKWEHDHAPQQQRPQPQTNNSYVPPYQQSPNNNTTIPSPFGEAKPPPINQPDSPYSTLDSLIKQNSSNTTAPLTTSPTAPSSLSSPDLKAPTTLFPLRNQGLGSRTGGLFNPGSTPSTNNLFKLTPNATPTSAPLAPSNGVRNFGDTLNEINQKTGQ
jgi:curved DNA-binding protein CbpA